MHSDDIKASAIVLVPDRLEFDYFASSKNSCRPMVTARVAIK